ncbi:MAG: alanine racemase [Phycisphaerales bacterium]|nr:alanine racemase [Phycisphaerales bacterium]
MPPSRHATVRIDLTRVRRNAEAVRAAAGVPIIAVVKADAYGLGAAAVAKTLADLVDGFYVFDLAEAVAYDLRSTGRRTIALWAESHDPADYLVHKVQPAVWSPDVAAALAKASPILSVETGQQRFGLPVTDAAGIDAVLAAAGGAIGEAFTHATRPDQAVALTAALRGKVPKLHAAGTALIEQDPAAALDAVRPGLALYRGAVRTAARLVEVTDSNGPAGYTGFSAPRHGVILAGYSHGLRAGPCVVNGRRTRLLEVGMQSAFVECGPEDRVGDEVALLGDGVAEQDVAAAWGCTPHEVVLRMCAMGAAAYVGDRGA